MARAITQNIAWMTAFLLSSVVFAVLISLVFMLNPDPQHQDSHEEDSNAAHDSASSEHGAAAGHGEKKAAADSTPAPHGEKKTGSESQGAHGETHAQSPEEPAGDEEISAESIKKKGEHKAEADPHH